MKPSAHPTTTRSGGLAAPAYVLVAVAHADGALSSVSLLGSRELAFARLYAYAADLARCAGYRATGMDAVIVALARASIHRCRGAAAGAAVFEFSTTVCADCPLRRPQ